MRSSSIRRLRSGLIAWRRESSFVATASSTNTTRSKLFSTGRCPEASSAIRPNAMTVPPFAMNFHDLKS
jgi:hypothetical protein